MGFIPDWAQIRVSALPRSHVDRLRRITRADLDRLAVVAQFENREGLLERVPAGVPGDRDAGVRLLGTTVQLGLTRHEIDGIDADRPEIVHAAFVVDIELELDAPFTRLSTIVARAPGIAGGRYE